MCVGRGGFGCGGVGAGVRLCRRNRGGGGRRGTPIHNIAAATAAVPDGRRLTAAAATAGCCRGCGVVGAAVAVAAAAAAVAVNVVGGGPWRWRWRAARPWRLDDRVTERRCRGWPAESQQHRDGSTLLLYSRPNTFNGTLLYLTGRLGGTAVQRAASREPAASSQHRRWRLNDRSVYDGGGERRLGDREPAASTCDARPSRALTRVTLRLPMGGAQPAARRRATFPCERVEAGRLGGAERAAERRRRRRGGPSSFLAVMEFSSLSLKQNTQNT